MRRSIKIIGTGLIFTAACVLSAAYWFLYDHSAAPEDSALFDIFNSGQAVGISNQTASLR